MDPEQSPLMRDARRVQKELREMRVLHSIETEVDDLFAEIYNEMDGESREGENNNEL